jgi:hypothetical protein
MSYTNLPTDLPESHLQIGETVFYQFFQDMNVNVPTDWDILEDPIYYTTINGQVVLYNDITRELVTESQTTLEPVTESQDNQYSVYEVSTVEGLENDDNPEYNVYIVTATNPNTALETIKARLMSQKTRFNILGVSEAPIVEDDDEWLES